MYPAGLFSAFKSIPHCKTFRGGALQRLKRMQKNQVESQQGIQI